ncbi:MAG: glycosyltransferase family 2 protein [Candidatus Fonsibacter sp.]|nr:glycosyltransferase family 2 protein [Candidatus Fonsibacter sp.]
MKIQKSNKKSLLKKIFIKICRILNFEIIDQSDFTVPSLKKRLDENLSSAGKKSITLPMGEVKITRQINSLNIIFRFCTKVKMLTQSKQRLFEEEKNQYTLRSLNSILKSIQAALSNFKYLDIKITAIDSGSEESDVEKIKNMIKEKNINFEYIKLDINELKDFIDAKASANQKSNMANIYKSFEIGRNGKYDLLYFVEDDYIHEQNSLNEMLFTYEKFASLIKDELILCPADFPYLYNKFEPTQIILGNNKHWRVVEETLCTFLTSKRLLLKHWDTFVSMTKTEHLPFEKPLHEIYSKQYCLSPIPSLAMHCTNINSIYGLSPVMEWKKLWDENKLND